MTSDKQKSSPALRQEQRSHVLFVLSHPQAGQESDFLKWYQRAYRKVVSKFLGVQHYEQHEVDITKG